MADTSTGTGARSIVLWMDGVGYQGRCLNGKPDLAEATEYIATALAEAKRQGAEEMRERVARLVDHHPFADDATEGCEDAQGCCEMMAAQIRALSTDA